MLVGLFVVTKQRIELMKEPIRRRTMVLCRPQISGAMVKQFLVAVFVLCSVACFGQNSAPAQSLDVLKGMKQYFIGFFVMAEKPALSEEEQQTLFQKHVAYVRSEEEAGKYRLAGPLQDNGRIAGILIIDTPMIDEAKGILSKDALVLSGRVTAEVHPIMLPDVSCVLTQHEKSGGR
jgi:uncharacterized protein YciI